VGTDWVDRLVGGWPGRIACANLVSA
jgi:hypothetical protein